MKRSKVLIQTLLTGGLLFCTGCIDDKYDLSDIDTTTAIKLNDLTVPVKLDQITLDDVLDIDDEDNIIKVVSGPDGQYYAIEQSGFFSADPVYIPVLRANSEFTIPEKKFPVSSGNINNVTAEFSYLINDVHESLMSLDYFGLEEENPLVLNLSVSPATAVLTDVQLQIPETFVAKYNGTTFTGGVIPVTIKNGELESPVYITEMNFDPVLTPKTNEAGVRYLNIGGNIGIKSAKVAGASDLTLKFSMSSFTANVVTGSVDYEVEAPEIDPISLDGLPDFLTEGDTNLVIENPQIYLNFSEMNGANYKFSLLISPRGNDASEIFINIDPFQSAMVLAPDINNLGLYGDYPGAETQPVPELRNILSGDGLPESISFSLEETRLQGTVDNLELGVDKTLAGNYSFFSPLAFGAGSRIIYSKIEDDFFGDDMEDVEVSKFVVSANVTTNLPFAVNLTLYPLDKAGNRLAESSATVPANANNSPFKIEFLKKFNGLDGIEFIVTVDDMTGQSLTPSQYLKLDNISATVTGEYVTKFGNDD
ncbi:MAG: hypothetical protein J1F38_01235 [Muribaculaceae bacterium]|nr:hypothetical protein [Muribaculaceae bacterium]